MHHHPQSSYFLHTLNMGFGITTHPPLILISLLVYLQFFVRFIRLIMVTRIIPSLPQKYNLNCHFPLVLGRSNFNLLMVAKDLDIYCQVLIGSVESIVLPFGHKNNIKC